PPGCHAGPSVKPMSPANFCTRASGATHLLNCAESLMAHGSASAAMSADMETNDSNTGAMSFIGFESRLNIAPQRSHGESKRCGADCRLGGTKEGGSLTTTSAQAIAGGNTRLMNKTEFTGG